MNEDNEPDVWSEYAFDPNSEYPIVAPSEVVETCNGHDFNNNDDYPQCQNEIDMAVENISISEYSYKAFSNIRHYWAGPTYWKFRQNRNAARDARKLNSHAQTKDRQKRGKPIEIPTFGGDGGGSDSNSSDEEIFLKSTAKNAKLIRQCQYRCWWPDKVKLPAQLNIPKDLFYTYTFGPSIEIFGTNHGKGSVEEHYEENDVQSTPSQMHFYQNNDYDDEYIAPVSIQVDEINNSDENGAANISQNYENAPQMVRHG